jgi:hypothetical protein
MSIEEAQQDIRATELRIRQLVEELEARTGLTVARLEIGHCLYEGKPNTPVKIHAEL